MAVKKAKDTFANVAALLVTESAANTQTSAKFAFPFSIMDKMGLIIARVEYWFNVLSQFNSSGDGVYIGLSAAAAITSITSQNDPLLIDSCWISRVDLGTAASGVVYTTPLVKDFTDLPGGGLLVAPNPFYGIIQSSGAAGANAAWIKVFYTYMEMDTDEYWQLVESRRVISS